MSPVSVRLYGVFHKPFYQPAVDFVIPIQAGKANATVKLAMIGDDTGDNISALNPFFCELTVLYWIWKNVPFASNDYWGLCHYRRYFYIPFKNVFISKSKVLTLYPLAGEIDMVVNKKLQQYMLHQFCSHDVIVQKPQPTFKKRGKALGIEAHYLKDHVPDDWALMKKTVLELYPDYAECLGQFCNQTTLSFANMMVAKATVWNDYLSWLFPIMFTMYPKMKISEDAYQSRAIAFISERLLNLYLLKKSYKTAYMFIATFDKV